jgi:hypothetical protein
MENKAEDEIRKKWQQEAKDEAKRDEEAAQRPKKRPRAIGYRNNADDVVNNLELEALLDGTADRSRSATKTRGGVTKTRQARGSRAKSKTTELTEEEEEVVELD